MLLVKTSEHRNNSKHVDVGSVERLIIYIITVFYQMEFFSIPPLYQIKV